MQYVFPKIVDRCRIRQCGFVLIICSLIFMLTTYYFILHTYIQHTSVSKVKNNYKYQKERSNLKSQLLYNELKKSFQSSDVSSTEKLVHNSSQFINEKCDIIHIGLVSAGYKSNNHLYIMLKSLLFYGTNPFHFHILVNNFSEKVLRNLFDTWDLPEVNITFYNISQFIPDVRWVPNSHYSGIYGLTKLLFTKILSINIDKVIILDTDLTFVSDIYELWTLFKNFDYMQAIGLAENESDFYLSKKSSIWPALGRGYNTGVILYRLDRLRALSWDLLWKQVTKKAVMSYGATSLGDQDIMNTVIKQYPHFLYEVPCSWNVQLSDHTNSYRCYRNNPIKIIHWNSPKKFNVANKDAKYFRSVYNSFLNIDLTRVSLLDCFNKSANTTDSYTDVCSEFNRASTSKYRTLLFIKDFDYIPVDHDVTFVAQLSYDRLHMVEELTKHWEGPISLTLYVTDPEFQQVNQFIDNSEILEERTNIAYHVVFKQGEYYPINLLRNVGLRNVNTPYVFLADIDFLPMFGLYNTLRNTLMGIKYMKKKALIVPAFETQRYRSKFPKNKVELLRMFENKSLFTFRYDIWASGHAPTDYNKWKTAKAPYTVKWEADFEPYIVVKKDVIEYDNRFMGFGWNKVSHIMELECQNYEFIVLHNAFIIHKPHSPSYDIAKFRNSPIYRMCLQNLKEAFVEKLKSKYGRVFDNNNTPHV